MKDNILFLAFALLPFIACKSDLDKKPIQPVVGQNTPVTPPATPAAGSNVMVNKSALFGKWHGSEWLLDGKPSGVDPSIVHFEFKEDGSFKANYGDQHRTGTWRISRDSLYTLEQGKPELPIRLLTFDGKALAFEMNLKGKAEVLKFKRE